MKKILQFPCDFPLKIIGKHSASFFEEMTHIVQEYFPNTPFANYTYNLSKNENYAAITVILFVTAQAPLDALYHELTAHHATHMVL